MINREVGSTCDKQFMNMRQTWAKYMFGKDFLY